MDDPDPGLDDDDGLNPVSSLRFFAFLWVFSLLPDYSILLLLVCRVLRIAFWHFDALVYSCNLLFDCVWSEFLPCLSPKGS